ncbi:unnamed protein product, partial [Iphiclides podalirius]
MNQRGRIGESESGLMGERFRVRTRLSKYCSCYNGTSKLRRPGEMRAPRLCGAPTVEAGDSRVERSGADRPALPLGERVAGRAHSLQSVQRRLSRRAYAYTRHPSPASDVSPRLRNGNATRSFTVTVQLKSREYGLNGARYDMSPGERAALGRREPARPQYAATAPGFPPPYYPPYGVPHPNAWLGAPLISMAGRNTPVSKLAMHAQGAPLIIHNRHDRRKYTTVPEQRNHRPGAHVDHGARDRCEAHETNRARNQQQPPRSARSGRNNNNNTDAVSVASDESSGSTNSETMLPRIIKPRKRRKKDRKPNNIVPHDMTAAALEIGDVGHGAVGSMSAASHGVYDESYCRNITMQYRLDVKVLEYSEPAPETYRVVALGEALEATRFGLAEAASPSESAVSSCQCRYCDPVGQIWDADSIADLLDENSSGDFAPTKLEDSMKVVGPLGRRGADTVLRRSWSDPSSRVADRRDANAAEPQSSSNLYSLFPPSRRASSPEPRSPLALEISSEIVTSMNGHRDLEIKLFSTSPPAAHADRRSFFDGKSESAADGCTIAADNSRVDCAVNSEQGVPSVSDYVDAGCSTANAAAKSPRGICDLALVAA